MIELIKQNIKELNINLIDLTDARENLIKQLRVIDSKISTKIVAVDTLNNLLSDSAVVNSDKEV